MDWGDLPQVLDVNGVERAINADYRDIVEIIAHLTDVERGEAVNVYVAMSLFYEDFEVIPKADYKEATDAMLRFINGGDEPTNDNPNAKKLIDWQQDRQMIVADVNKVAGCEVRSLAFCHWWTFLGWFNGIGDGQLSTVVAIRDKKNRHKKLDDWEQEFYQRNRSKVDFEQKYTKEETDLFDAWRT